jgi:hypothetical protein
MKHDNPTTAEQAIENLELSPTELKALPNERVRALIKDTHKKLALLYHPDKNPAEEARRNFLQAQSGYELLSLNDFAILTSFLIPQEPVALPSRRAASSGQPAAVYRDLFGREVTVDMSSFGYLDQYLSEISLKTKRRHDNGDVRSMLQRQVYCYHSLDRQRQKWISELCHLISDAVDYAYHLGKKSDCTEHEKVCKLVSRLIDLYKYFVLTHGNLYCDEMIGKITRRKEWVDTQSVCTGIHAFFKAIHENDFQRLYTRANKIFEDVITFVSKNQQSSSFQYSHQ